MEQGVLYYVLMMITNCPHQGVKLSQNSCLLLIVKVLLYTIKVLQKLHKNSLGMSSNTDGSGIRELHSGRDGKSGSPKPPPPGLAGLAVGAFVGLAVGAFEGE